MKCENCGASIRYGMVECEYCGSRVDTMMTNTASNIYEKQKPDLKSMIAGLKNTDQLFFDAAARSSNAINGAMSKYLYGFGYTPAEQILLLYDDAVFKAGERGFTLTNRGIYSSGCLWVDKAFFIPLGEIATISLDDSNLVVNGRKIDICLIDRVDRQPLRDIVRAMVSGMVPGRSFE